MSKTQKNDTEGVNQNSSNKGGTSIGSPRGATSNGTKTGTSIGGATKNPGTSIGELGAKNTGTSIGVGAAKNTGTSIGGGGAKNPGTSIGGSGTKAVSPRGGETKNTVGGTKTGTTVASKEDGGEEHEIASPPETPKNTGTSIGGGAQKPAGTSIGGAATKPVGTSVGGVQKTAGTSIGGGSGPKAAVSPRGGAQKNSDVELGKPEETQEAVSHRETPKTTGTSVGGGPKPAGTSVGGPKPTGTSVGGGAPKPTSIGGGPKPSGTSIGGGSGPKPSGTSGGETTEQNDNEAGDEDGESEVNVGGKKKRVRKKGATSQQPEPNETKTQPPAKQPPKPKGAAALAARQIKKMQEEQERIRREEEEIRKKEEEEERLRVEKEKQEEEEKKLRAEKNKGLREEAKKRQQEVENQKIRAEAIRKYGYDPTEHVQQQKERNAGGRGGRGRGRGGRDQRTPDEIKNPSKETETETEPETEQEPVEPPKKEPTEIENWETVAEDTWETTKEQPEEEDWEQLESKNSAPVPEKIDSPPPTQKPNPSPEKVLKSENELSSKARRQEEEKRKREELQRKKDENLEKKKTTFRSPICCVLGHVDTGKTLLLDKIRSSSVQAGEAGGITQQIGATFFPMAMIRKMTVKVEETMKKALSWKLPGLLVIDTPGHESFTNLRSRGSSLCDIAILVVDLMHGLEPQTRESIHLLKNRRTPFVIALNKVDRLFGWKSFPGAAINQSLQAQDSVTKLEFEDRVKETIGHLAGEGLNAELYYKNKDIRKIVSLVPTSAVTGEGLPDLLLLLIQLSQNLMSDKLLELSTLDCTVLEVKRLVGHGTTLDVILANGVLKQGDKIMVCGLNGEPIITTIKSILLPPPATELRIKSEYIVEKVVQASIGCKIDAPNLDDAVAGSPLFVINPGDNIEEYKKQVTGALNYLEGKVDRAGVGVYVQASTLGSMEALLDFLKEVCNIPVSGIRIGDVMKRDVMRASIMLEKAKPEYAVILAFDVKVTTDVRQIADQLGVRILEANIIYHLEKQFTDYLDEIENKKKVEFKGSFIFPCILRIIGKETIFNKKDPIICGVKVEEGILRIGTPIVIIQSEDKKLLELGSITKIEKERGVELEEAKVGEDVSICITVADEKKQKYMFGRHFDETNLLYSNITRESIDALKEFHKDLVKQKEIYYCIVNLKQVLKIQ